LRELLLEIAGAIWLRANLFAGHALLNLLDDPAILAIGFC
jgi:hypothetical protein